MVLSHHTLQLSFITLSRLCIVPPAPPTSAGLWPHGGREHCVCPPPSLWIQSHAGHRRVYFTECKPGQPCRGPGEDEGHGGRWGASQGGPVRRVDILSPEVGAPGSPLGSAQRCWLLTGIPRSDPRSEILMFQCFLKVLVLFSIKTIPTMTDWEIFCIKHPDQTISKSPTSPPHGEDFITHEQVDFSSLFHPRRGPDPAGGSSTDQVPASGLWPRLCGHRSCVPDASARCCPAPGSQTRAHAPLIPGAQDLISALRRGCPRGTESFPAHLGEHQSFSVLSVQTCSSVSNNTSRSLGNYFWINTGPGTAEMIGSHNPPVLHVSKQCACRCLLVTRLDVASVLLREERPAQLSAP